MSGLLHFNSYIYLHMIYIYILIFIYIICLSIIYRALDDSAQAVQVPVQQMERMQKVIEAWESQVSLYIYVCVYMCVYI